MCQFFKPRSKVDKAQHWESAKNIQVFPSFCNQSALWPGRCTGASWTLTKLSYATVGKVSITAEKVKELKNWEEEYLAPKIYSIRNKHSSQLGGFFLKKLLSNTVTLTCRLEFSKTSNHQMVTTFKWSQPTDNNKNIYSSKYLSQPLSLGLFLRRQSMKT